MKGIKEVNCANDYYAEMALNEGYRFIKSLKTGAICMIAKDSCNKIIYTEVDKENID